MYTTTTTSSADSFVRSFLINPLRILEYMLGTTCLIIHIYCDVFLKIKMAEVLKNLVYVTACSFIIIISHDLILTCIKKPLDYSTWLLFSFTATVLYAVCAGMSAFWELTSYIKWIYFAITFVNTLMFGLDSLSILWHFRKMVHDRIIVLPLERSSTRRNIKINDTKRPEVDLQIEVLPSLNASRVLEESILIEPPTTILVQRPTVESMHNVAIQCDSLEQIDLNRLPSVPSTSRYMPIATTQHTTIIPSSPPTIYTHYHKRKRHGCHGCHACDPITNMTGNYSGAHASGGSASTHLGLSGTARPATTTSTYGGTFHVSKDIAPLSSPAGSGRQGVAGSSTHKMKSPWTNESLYVWEGKPTRFGDDGDEMMKRY